MGGTKKKTGRGKKAGTIKRRRGGNGYGMGAVIAPGVVEFKANNTSNPGGKIVVGGKKKKGSRRRRGGSSIAHVGASFTGEGVRGLATYKPMSQPYNDDVVSTK
jgi:hypothetical protein